MNLSAHILPHRFAIAAAAFMCISALPSLSTAQELNEEVAIQGHYAPKVIKVDKIYTFPQQEPISLQAPTPQYSKDAVITDFHKDLLPLPPTSFNSSRNYSTYKGYIDLSLGSWLDSNLSAGYKAFDSKKSTFGVALQHNSTSLWQPFADSDVKRFMYDENLMLYGSHKLTDSGTLSAAANWHFGYFNYFSAKTEHSTTQTLNDICARLIWADSSAEEYPLPLCYNTTFYLRSFNYRSFYMPELNRYFSADKENHLSLSNEIRLDNADHQFHFPISIQALIYSKSDIYNSEPLYTFLPLLLTDKGSDLFVTPKNYMMVSLSPMWSYKRGKFNIAAGAEADITINARGSHANEHFSAFHVSPTMKLAYKNSKAAFWLDISGGTHLNTMASLAGLIYYSTPLMQCEQPSFSPIDATMGARMSLFPGFTASISAQYKNELHTPVAGWYPYCFSTDKEKWVNAFSTQGIDLHGIAIKADFDYNPSSFITTSLSACWTPQNGSFGIFNGADRPRYSLKADIQLSPIKNFDCSVQYILKGGRKIYLSPSEKYDLRNISNLSLTASYDILSNLKLSLSATNLLDRKIEILPSLPDQGIAFYGGFQWLF